MKTGFDIMSLGYVAQTLQLPLAEIIAAAAKAGIPASRINGIAHYSATDVDKIRRVLAGRKSGNQSTKPSQVR